MIVYYKILTLTLLVIISSSAITQEILSSQSYPRAKNAIIVEENFIININGHSIEIFNIRNENLHWSNEFKISGQIQSALKYNNFLFVTEIFPKDRIYKLNISELGEITVIDTLEMRGCYINFIYENALYVNEIIGKNHWNLNSYGIKTGTLIKRFKIPYKEYPLRHLKDSLFYSVTFNEILLYSFTHEEFILSGKHKLSKLSNPFSLELLNDTVLVFSSALSGLIFYDIRNPLYWREINKINLPIVYFKKVQENRMIVNSKETQIRFYNIEDLANISVLDSIDLQFENIGTINASDSELFFTSIDGTLFYYLLEGDGLKYIDEHKSYGRFKDIAISGNDLLVMTTYEGILSAPLPVEKEMKFTNPLKESNNTEFFKDYPNHLLVFSRWKENNYTEIMIHEKSDKSEDGCLFRNLPRNIALFKEKYLVYCLRNKLYISSIDRSTVYRELIEFEKLGYSPVKDIYTRSDFVFLRTNNEMLVYELTDLKPKYVGKFNIYMPEPVELAFYENNLIVSSTIPGSGCDFYDISDLRNIELINSLSFSGKLSVDPRNKLLFVGSSTCHVFDISEIGITSIPKITEFNASSPIVSIVNCTIEKINYLFVLEEASLRKFEYSR